MNARQARFVDEYLIDGNATQAAIRAGYSAKTAHVTGHHLLRNPKVALWVKAGQIEQAERNKLTQDEVIAGLRKEATLYGDGASHGARVTAWAQLGKHLGMFTDGLAVSGKDGAPLTFSLNLGAASVTDDRDLA